MSDFTVGSVGVDLVPSAKGFAEKTRALLRGLTADVTLNANADKFRADMDELTRSRQVTVNANLDTGAARAELDELTRSRSVDVNAGSGLSGLLGGLSGTTGLIAGLGPALVPITAAVAGLGAALVAPVAAAGGGLTVGALIAGRAISQTQAQYKLIDQLQLKLAGLKKGTKEYAKTQDDLLVLTNELTPAQKRFHSALTGVQPGFGALVRQSSPAIFGPVTKGLEIFAAVLPKLPTVIRPVATALDGLLDDVAGFTKSAGFNAFLKGFGQVAGRSITVFGTAAGKVFLGLGHLFASFAPLSGKVLKGISGLGSAFERWATSSSTLKGVQSFMGYVAKVGPQVAKLFGNLVLDVVNVAKVLAPFGGIVINVAGAFARLIATAKPSTLAAIAAAAGGLFLALAPEATPIEALVGATAALTYGLTYLGSKSKTVRKVMGQFGDWIKGSLVPALKSAGGQALQGLVKGFDSVRSALQKNPELVRDLTAGLKLYGDYITKSLLPALGWLANKGFPAVGKAIAVEIKIVGSFLSSMRALASGLISIFAKFLGAVGKVLGVLAKLPSAAGFGWAKSAAKSIDGASSSLSKFARGLNSLKSPAPITVKVNYAYSNKPRPPDPTARASGGPVSAGHTYKVGEVGPELFTPASSGFITSNADLRAMRSLTPAAQTVASAPYSGPVTLSVGDVEFEAYMSAVADDRVAAAGALR